MTKFIVALVTITSVLASAASAAGIKTEVRINGTPIKEEKILLNGATKCLWKVLENGEITPVLGKDGKQLCGDVSYSTRISK